MHYFQLDGVTPIALTAPATAFERYDPGQVGGLAPVPTTGFQTEFCADPKRHSSGHRVPIPTERGHSRLTFCRVLLGQRGARLATNSTMAVTQNATHDATVTVTNTSLRATDVEGDMAGDADTDSVQGQWYAPTMAS